MAEDSIIEESVVADELTAKERLRAFEDERLGDDAPRVNGHLERGHGSLFQKRLSDDEKREHAALEKLVHAEEELQKATEKLAKAQVKHAEAAEAVDKHRAEEDAK